MAPRISLRKQTPTKQVTGTQYRAGSTSAMQPSAEDYKEYGSSIQAKLPDLVPELVNRQTASRIYDQMVNGDASVDVSLRATKMPVLSATYFLEPHVPDDPLSEVTKEFVEDNLFNNNFSWPSLMENVMRMYEDGFSVFEDVYELREWAPVKSQAGANRKQYTMLKYLAYRPAVSIGQINYDDNGNLLSVDHNAIRADRTNEKVTLKAQNLVVFTFNKRGGSIEGKSILRTAYPHWFYKNTLYKIDAISKERHGIGVPDIELPAGYTKKDKEAAHTLGQNLRTNEFAYVVRPPGMTVGFITLHGHMVNVMESAVHHDMMIMKNVMVQFLNLGIEGAGGGRATGATAFDMFMKANKYVANYICDIINSEVIPKLVAYNFKTDKFPKLRVRNVGETKDLQMWAAAHANLLSELAITADDETEGWYREQLDMPQKKGKRAASLDERAKLNLNVGLTADPNDPNAATNTNGKSSQKGTVKTSQGGNTGKSPSSGA